MEAEFFLQSVSTVQPKIGAKLGNRENAEKLDLPLKMALLKRRAKVGKMTHSNYESSALPLSYSGLSLII